MEPLVLALGPAFAAGFAIQRLLEIVDSVIVQLPKSQAWKGPAISVLSLIAGQALAFFGGIRVLAPLGIPGHAVLDAIATGLIISAGTEGANSILKFLGYAKDDRKAVAAQNLSRAGNAVALIDDRGKA